MFSLKVPAAFSPKTKAIRLQPQSHRAPSAPEDPRRVCLDLPQHRPEVRRRGQGIVGVSFPVLVPAIQRPGFISLAVPDPGDVGLGPDGFVLPTRPLLEERNGEGMGDRGERAGPEVGGYCDSLGESDGCLVDQGSSCKRSFATIDMFRATYYSPFNHIGNVICGLMRKPGVGERTNK